MAATISTCPCSEVAGNENQLSILVRVTSCTSDGRKDDPSYFFQRISVPKLPEDAKGEAVLSGLFDLGEGKYHVDLLMKDRSERVCSFYWDAEAVLADRDKEIQPAIAAGAVERAEYEQFNEEPPVERAPGKPLNIKILVNFAPQNSSLSSLRPIDTLALVTVLRRLSREPQFGKFSVVAFNVQEQRVLYRQSSEERIDFPALGRAIQGVEPGKVDLKQLSQKHGEVSFLSDLIKKEIANDHPDAVIFAGPKVLLDDSVPGGGPEAPGVRRNLPGVLHELQPEPAGRPLERCHRQGDPELPGHRVQHQPAARFVVRRLRGGFAYSKIKSGRERSWFPAK